MIFAFLFGLSMDYEVFMLTRMREAYDEIGDTTRAVALGLARTGKLVTSAALVLMFAFFVLSSGPGVDIKQFGIVVFVFQQGHGSSLWNIDATQSVTAYIPPDDLRVLLWPLDGL
jgi:hypothetical protein